MTMASMIESSSADLAGFWENDLECPKCLSTLSRPRLLSCLHAVCHTCAPLCARPGDGSLVCPQENCARLTSSSFAIPDHHLLRHKLQARSGEADKRRCDECLEDEAEEATVVCEDCLIALCAFHERAHKRSRSTAKHRLSKGSQAFSQVEAVAAKCSFHGRADLNQFCEKCRQVVCDYCAALPQHSGHIMKDVALVVPELSGEMERLSVLVENTALPALRDRLTSAQKSIGDVNVRAEEMSDALTGFVQRMMDRLKEEERRMVEEIDRARWREQIELEKDKLYIEGLLSMSERAARMASPSIAHLSGAELLQIVVTALPYLNEAAEAKDSKTLARSVKRTWNVKLEGLEDFEQSFIELVEKEGLGHFTGADVPQHVDLAVSSCPEKANSPFDITILMQGSRDVMSECRANLKCVIKPPCGEGDQLTLVFSIQPSTTAATATARYTPVQKGMHKVEISTKLNGRVSTKTRQVSVGE